MISEIWEVFYVNIEFVRVTFISEYDFASYTVNDDEIDKWPVSLLQHHSKAIMK